jgi:hypothetical protein
MASTSSSYGDTIYVARSLGHTNLNSRYINSTVTVLFNAEQNRIFEMFTPVDIIMMTVRTHSPCNLFYLVISVICTSGTA